MWGTIKELLATARKLGGNAFSVALLFLAVVFVGVLWVKTRDPELLRIFSLLAIAFIGAALVSLHFPGEGK